MQSEGSSHLVLIEASKTNSRVAMVTLNRPSARNALSRQLLTQLNLAFRQLQYDDHVNVVVLTGHKNFFSAGADISELSEMKGETEGESQGGRVCEDYLQLWNCVSVFKKPVICAVSGYAVGGGFELVLMCDIILCADNSVFSLPELKLGLLPAAGGTQRLTRCVGKHRALYMMLTTESISAKQALQMGIVSRVCDKDQLINEALKLADTLTQMSPVAVSHIKQLVNCACDGGCMSVCSLLERSMFVNLLNSSPDAGEKINKFLQRKTN